MTSLSTLVTVRDGKLKLLAKDEYERGLAQFMDGQELVLTIEEAEQHRTSAQNRFLWAGVVPAFMTLGYGKQEAHDVICLKFIPQDIKLLDGSIVRVPGHTSSLKKAEFNAFLEECIQLAAELDIVIQDGAEWRAKHQRAVA